MQIKRIPHGFTHVYRQDARGVLYPAEFRVSREEAKKHVPTSTPTLRIASHTERVRFQNYDDARRFLNEHADQRFTYYLSEVPYA